MSRVFTDCREFPEMKCTVAISADREDVLLNVALQHAVAVHQYQDTPEVRAQLRSLVKKGTPK